MDRPLCLKELSFPKGELTSASPGEVEKNTPTSPAQPATLSATSLPVPFELGPSVQVPGSQRQLLSHCRVSGLPHPSPQERMWSLEPNPSRRELTPGLGRGFLFLVLTAWKLGRSLLASSRLRLLPRSQPLRLCEKNIYP